MFLFFFASLLLSLYLHISLLYPLLLGLVGFVLIARLRGHSFLSLSRMLLQGSRQSLIVIRIFVLIGAITAVWRACGTIPYIVYHGIGVCQDSCRMNLKIGYSI